MIEKLVILLRNRSRAMTTKQALVTDHSSQSSPTQKKKRTVPSLFDSPKFKAFTTKVLAETEIAVSPTSILDTRPFSPFGNPFWDDKNPPKSPKFLADNKRSWDKSDSKAIGLAIIDVLTHGEKTIEENSISKPNNKLFFGTRLRVQIPLLPPSNLSPARSPNSPTDFVIKTRTSQLALDESDNCGTQIKEPPKVSVECLSVSEMELSEDYTCVISHGPNPKTTHIFDNCIIERYCSLSDKSKPVPENFLSFCYTCKKNLEQKNDIYIYRGDKAFCSQECRYQEMMIDEVEN